MFELSNFKYLASYTVGNTDSTQKQSLEKRTQLRKMENYIYMTTAIQ